mgnify:CR=1 FL=1
MKKSGIFWSVLIIGILYYLFNIDILTFLIGYLVFCVIGLIIQIIKKANNSEKKNIHHNLSSKAVFV